MSRVTFLSPNQQCIALKEKDTVAVNKHCSKVSYNKRLITTKMFTKQTTQTVEMLRTLNTKCIFTGRVSGEGNAISCVRLFLSTVVFEPSDV